MRPSFIGVEEQRLRRAAARLPEITGRYQHLIDEARQLDAPAQLIELGRRLWREAAEDVRQQAGDDRSLYWTRLAIRSVIAASGLAAADADRFEAASRGFEDVSFPREAGLRRVLITGFDPFHLDEDVSQSNPSGLAALALDGIRLDMESGAAQVEAALMPVRFADFDQGRIERFLRPQLEDGGLDLVVTISMGRDAFDLERFPGRRRSSPTPDNANVLTGADPSSPTVPLLGDDPLAGPEFVEFSLPAEHMREVTGPYRVRDNSLVTTLERGELQPASIAELAGLTAVSGSGGGYLSNEISYRSVLLARQLRSDLAIGHLHTPRVAGFDAAAEWQMVSQIERLLRAALNALPGT